MKPNINDEIWCIYHDGIYSNTVGYLGENSFIVKSFKGKNQDSVEYAYESYNRTWFTDIEEAKRYLLDRYNKESVELKRYDSYAGTWYYVEYKD